MNKRELVESIAGQVDASKQQVEDVLDRFTEVVGATLKKGERLALTGFGAFEARKRAARTGQNPQTGEKIKIKATVVPAFKPGQALKDEVAGSRGGAKKASSKKSSAKKASAKKASGKKAAPKKTGAKKAAPKKTAKKAGAKKTAKAAGAKKTVKKAARKR